jgi:hypothetical protein
MRAMLASLTGQRDRSRRLCVRESAESAHFKPSDKRNRAVIGDLQAQEIIS